MIGPPPPADRLLPRDGDVVVTRESSPAVRYTLRQLPGIPQLAASSRDEALQVARAFARMLAIDVWYCDDDGYRLLEAYRRPVDEPT